jgi:hypothetical protein
MAGGRSVNNFPQINSRRHLDEQERFKVVPASDQDAPGRIPVEVLEMQMRQFGMHARFHPDGSSMAAINEVRRKVGVSFTEGHRKRVDADEKLKTCVSTKGLVDITELKRIHSCSSEPIYNYIRAKGIKAVCKSDRRVYYRPDDFAGLKLQRGHPNLIHLSDGRVFKSIAMLSRALGKSDNFVHGRLKRLKLPPTNENIERVIGMKRLKETKHSAIRRWCEIHDVAFANVWQRAKYHRVPLTLERCEEWYGGGQRAYRKTHAKETQPDQPSQPGHAVGGSHRAMECHEWREAHHYAGGA